MNMETSKMPGKRFFAKCNKMASFTRFINIIVPGKPEKEIVLKELEEWKNKCLEGEYPLKWERPIEGRVLTYNELKSQNDVNDIRQVDWTKVTVSRPQKRKGEKVMTYHQILQSFIAFNINAFNNLLYITETNLWIILTIIGAIAIVIMNVREEIEDYVTEEQNII